MEDYTKKRSRPSTEDSESEAEYAQSMRSSGGQEDSGSDDNSMGSANRNTTVEADTEGSNRRAAKQMRPSQPLVTRDQTSSTTTTAMPGTLLYLSEQAKGDTAMDDPTAADYILRWTKIIDTGTDVFKRELNREQHRKTQHPTVFAVMMPTSNVIQLAHGFEEIVLDEGANHAADGKIGFFMGDQVTVTIGGAVHQQDPLFVMVRRFNQMTDKFHGKPATASGCAKANQELLPGDGKARMIDVIKICPIPPLWWSFFLTRARTPAQAYQWFHKVTRRWKTGPEKLAAEHMKQWLRAACTASLESVETSSVAVRIQPSLCDPLVVQWASSSLHQYLPRPKLTPNTQLERAPAPTVTATAPTPDQHTATIHQAMLLAQEVIKNSAERTNRERSKDKTLPETVLCRLLGLSGISWEDQGHLSPIWLKLHQQTDWAAKAMVLRAFFQDLGNQVPAFRQFRNSTLFDNITTYRFEPGAAYATCHHGISLLAVSMRSFAAQERESQDDEHFDRATNKTPEAVRKHSEKAPPPLPRPNHRTVYQPLFRGYTVTRYAYGAART
jgi:hypothetical protein